MAPIAARILAAQPYPPRVVNVADIWTMNWPLLAVIVVPGAILDLIFLVIPGVPRWVLLFLFLVQLSAIGIWVVLVIAPHVIALRQGMPDIATVVDIALPPRGGYRGRAKLDHGPGTGPVDFYYLTSHVVRVGDRLNVLMDSGSGKVMATLGPINQQ